MADNDDQMQPKGPADATVPVEPIVLEDQPPVAPESAGDAGGPTTAGTSGRRWGRVALVGAAAVGLVAASGLAGFAIGHTTSDDESHLTAVADEARPGDGQVPGRGAERDGWGPGRGTDQDADGDGPGRFQDGDGWGHHRGHGDGFGDRGPDGLGPQGQRGPQGQPGEQLPGMTDMPTFEEFQQWLEEQGVDLGDLPQPGGRHGMAGPGSAA